MSAAKGSQPKPLSSKFLWSRRSLWILGGLGVFLSLYLAYHHYAAGEGGGIYARFCGGEGSYLNCDVVLSSPYAVLGGVPLALWGTFAYLAILALALLQHIGPVVLLSSFAFGFSLYLAGVSLFVLQALCVFCSALYLINAGLFFSALYLFWHSGRFSRKHLAYGAVGVVASVAALGGWQAWGGRSQGAALEALGSNGKERTAFLRQYRAYPEVAVGGRERHVKGRSGAAVTVVEFIDFR